jgi:hypothetical protein
MEMVMKIKIDRSIERTFDVNGKLVNMAAGSIGTLTLTGAFNNVLDVYKTIRDQLELNIVEEDCMDTMVQ